MVYPNHQWHDNQHKMTNNIQSVSKVQKQLLNPKDNEFGIFVPFFNGKQKK